MNLRDAVVKLFSAGILLSVIEFVAIAYFTKVLGAAAIGSFFLYQALIGVTAIISNLGLSRAAEKELSAGKDSGEVITTTILLKALLLLPAITGAIVSHSYIDSYIGISGVSILVAVGLFTTEGRRLVIRLLAGQMVVQKTASLRILGKLTWVGVGAGLIFYGLNDSAILIGFIVGDLAVLVGGLIRLDLTISKPTMERASSLFAYGRYIFLRSAGSYVYSWMDVAVLGFFVPQSHIGAYEIAWRVASLSLLLTNAIRESIFPRISELHMTTETEQIKKLIYYSLQPPLYLAIPGLFGVIVLGKEVLGVPFGKGVIIAFPVLLIFMSEKIFRSTHLLFAAAVYAMNRPKLGYRGDVISLAVNLMLNIILVPKYGILGAAIATTASSLVAALINSYYLSTIIDLSLPWREISWSGVSSIFMASGIYLLKPHFPFGWMGLIIGIATGGLLYGLFLIANSNIRQEILSLKYTVD